MRNIINRVFHTVQICQWIIHGPWAICWSADVQI